MSRRGSKLTPLVVVAAVVSLAACSAAGSDAGSEDPAPVQTASEGRLSLAGGLPAHDCGADRLAPRGGGGPRCMPWSA
jgi:hypothetical protein